MKSARRRVSRAEALKVAAVLAAVAACDSGEVSGPPAVPASLAIAPASAALTYLGETVQFTARVTGGTGSGGAGTVRWSSTDEAVLTVDGAGLATAWGNGTAEVRASVGNLSDAATVRVEQRVAALRVFGDGKRALPGLSLPGRVGVKVVDSGDRAVAGTEVRFAVTAGGGSVDPETVVSDAAGLASAAWTVGPALGEQKLSVSVAGLPEAELTAWAVGPDSAVARIGLLQGGGASIDRTRRVGVVLYDGAGRPVGGALATFSPGSDDGSVQPDSARSDSLGRARTGWVLGPAQRDYTLLVSSGAARLEVTARLLDPTAAVRSVTVRNWDRETASAGQPLPVEVRLLRWDGRPVPGALATFAPGASGGTVQPDSARSGTAGYASTVWRIGRSPGDYTLEVTSGAARLELGVRALEPDSVAAAVVLWSGGGQWGVAGKPLPAPVVAQVLDDARAPVAGARVRFAPRAGSGSVLPESTLSDSTGLASAVWQLGATIGEQTLAVTTANESTLEVTATAQPDAGICGRTRAVIEEILRRTKVAGCADVTEEQLASIVSLTFITTNVPVLRSGDFAGLLRLEHIAFWFSGLRALPLDVFAGLDSLMSLQFLGNRLESLPAGTLSGLRNLEELDLAENRLTEIPPDVAGLEKLTSLGLASNPIRKVPPGSFANLTRLRELDLANVELEELSPGTFNGLAALEYFLLTGNRLTELPPGIFDDLRSLRTLSLQSNQLAELPPGIFANLVQLERLSMSRNGLDHLPGNVFAGLSSLKGLWLHENEFTELPGDGFAGLSGLRELSLGGNRLETLPPDIFAGLSRLEYLTLANNRLTALPPNLFEGLGRLERLRLEWNDLSSLPPRLFEGLSALARLRLTGNRLAALPDGIFEGLAALTELAFLSNELTELPPGVFRGLSRLERLDLRVNPGAPFPVRMELARIDAADLLAPGPASVTLHVPSGAPLSIEVPVTAQGGSVSGGSFTVPAGDTSSAALEVSRPAGGSGAVHLSLGPAPPTGVEVRGLEYVVGGQMALFAPSDNRAPVVAEEVPPHWLQAGVRTAEVDLAEHFSDPDGDSLSHVAESSDAGVVAARIDDGVLILEPLSEGSAEVEVTAEDPGGLHTSAGVPVTVLRAPDPGSFQIELTFIEGATEAERFTEAEKATVRRAAARWEELVTGDLPDVPFDNGGGCLPGPLVGRIDDLVIRVSISDAGRIHSIGQAGRCSVRESGLSLQGWFWLNRYYYGPDAAEAGPNSMYQVALHEMGHVLGIGSNKWDDMLRDPTPHDGVPRDTHFPGALAVEAFNEAGGRPYTGGKVPVDNGVSVSPNNHWRYEVLRGELMAPVGGGALSAITVQALADLGYEVDAGRADPYELPALDKAPAADAGVVEPLFAGDVIRGPVLVLDENGKVVRIIRN